MGLYNLCIVDRSGTVLLSYYFSAATRLEQDAYEVAATAASALWAAPNGGLTGGSGDQCFICDGHPVVVRVTRDLVFMLSGSEDMEEIALSETLDYAVAVVDATCDNVLTASQLMSYHGKIAVCLREMFYGGHLYTTDTETVLRNAKLKGVQ